MKLALTLLAFIGVATSAFTPNPTFGTRTSSSNSLNLSSNAAQDFDFSGVDLERVLGFRRIQNVKRKSGSSLSASSKSKSSARPPLGIIISGAPASGKGTQCEMIVQNYGVTHLSTGDMLRAAVAAGTEVGLAAKDFMDNGKLVPDEVIIGIVKDRMGESDCKNNGWLLDGFPRTKAQADALAEAGVSADCFLFLNVPDEALIERVVGRRTDPETGKIYHMTFSPPESEEIKQRLVQRSDDTEDKVKVRLEQFHANVSAVKGSYSDISVDIDGTQSKENVAKAISSALAKCAA